MIRTETPITFEEKHSIFPEYESLFSMETSDSLSKAEDHLSPISRKDKSFDLTQATEPSKETTKDRLSLLKPTSSGKKNKTSSSLNSHHAIFQHYMSDPALYADHFKVVRYMSYNYRVGNSMLIKNVADPHTDFLCKLIRIIKPHKVLNPQRILAFMEVQWYYKKSELPKKFSNYFPYISSNEVFLSTHKDFVMIDCINGPCQVVSFEEYDTLSYPPQNTFFTRATYDITKKKIEPPFDQWKKYCVCKTLMNPDLLYVQCDRCTEWYHTECIGLSKEQVDAIEQYFCTSCQNTSPPIKKKKQTAQEKSNVNLLKQPSHISDITQTTAITMDSSRKLISEESQQQQNSNKSHQNIFESFRFGEEEANQPFNLGSSLFNEDKKKADNNNISGKVKFDMDFRLQDESAGKSIFDSFGNDGFPSDLFKDFDVSGFNFGEN